MNAVIFSGGEIRDFGYLMSEFKRISPELVICADGGYYAAEKIGVKADVFVGDFDSFSGKMPENTEIHRSIPEKDDTDTILGVDIAIGRGAEKITLFGGLGGRFDHAFANIQTLIYAHEKGCKMEISDKGNRITLATEGRSVFKKEDEKYFSVFALTETLEIEYLRGVKYPLENYIMRQSYPIGVSNEILEEQAEIGIKSGTGLIVISDR